MPVPGERHPRPQHPAGAAGRGRRALPALRRGLADQRHQPRADRADRARVGRPRRRLPVYFGNRNWEPYVEDTVARDARQRRSAGPRCSPPRPGAATPGARSTRRTSPGRGPRSGDAAPELVKLRQYFDHPLLVEMFADGDRRCRRDTARGPARRGAAGVHRALDPVARRVAVRPGPLRAAGRATRRGWSPPPRATPTTTRCGSPGPVRRRCRGWSPMSAIISTSLVEAGTKAVIVVPDRFRRRPHRGGLGPRQRTRASRPTPPASRWPAPPRPNAAAAASPELVVDLIDELRHGRDPARVVGPEPVPGYGFSVDGALCTPACELAQRYARPSAGSR